MRTAKLARGLDCHRHACVHARTRPKPAQSEVIGAVNDISDRGMSSFARRGSMPGDLQQVMAFADPRGTRRVHGYSCMGYELQAVSALKQACPTVMCS